MKASIFSWLVAVTAIPLFAPPSLSTSISKYVIVMPKALLPSEHQSIFVQADIDSFSFVVIATNPTTKQQKHMISPQIINGSQLVSFRFPFDNYKEPTVKLSFNIYSCLPSFTASACAKFPKGLRFTNATTLPVLQSSLLLFADTSKPVYKPGETIRFRLLPLFVGNFRPSQYSNNLTYQRIQLQAPGKSVMAQWSNVSWSTAFNGLSYKLSRDPTFGKWRIKASIGSQVDEEEIEVKKYVLPRFTIELRPPGYLAINAKHVVFSVCSKYGTGLPMKGSMNAIFCTRKKSPNRYTKRRPCIKVNGTFDGLHDCLNFNESTEILQLRNYKYNIHKEFVFINATVVEKGTNVSVIKADFGGQLSSEIFLIEIDASKMYQPGLPFYGSIATRNSDGSPYSNASVHLDVSTSDYRGYSYERRGTSWGYRVVITTDENGIANFVTRPVPQAKSLTLNFKGISSQSEGRYYGRRYGYISMRVAKSSHTARPAKSPGNVHIQVYPLHHLPAQKACQSKRFRLRIQANVPLHNKRFQILVMSGGVIKDWQTVNVSNSSTQSSQCASVDSDSLGHYKCLKVVGQQKTVTCLPGWQGKNCLFGVCPAGCVKGVCIRPGVCQCKVGWSGKACNICVRKQRCEHGYCHFGDDCNCWRGWYGNRCERKTRWTSTGGRPRKPISVIPITNTLLKRLGKDEVADIFERDLNVEVKPEYGPAAYLTLYMYSGKEMRSPLVSVDVKLHNLRRCLEERTPTAFVFDKTEVRPGERLSAKINTTGSDVRCALSLYDVNLESLSTSAGVTLQELTEQVTAVMEKMVKRENGDPYWKSYEKACKRQQYHPWRRFETRGSRGTMLDARFGFDSSGLFVLTNAVSAFEECPPMPMFSVLEDAMDMVSVPRSEGLGATYRDGKAMGVPSSPQKNKPTMNSKQNKPKLSKRIKKVLKPRVRTFFPEAWKFEVLTNPGPVLNLTAPDTMTSWRSRMYCVSSAGLGVAPSSKLTVFQPFFLQMALPYSLIRGEAVAIPVKVFSYIGGCFEIELTAIPSPQLEILAYTRLGMCICAFEQKTATFTVLPKVLGKIPFQVSAISRDSTRCNNAGVYVPFKQTISDAVRRSILVEPEGLPEERNSGDIACPTPGRPLTVTLRIQLPPVDVVPQSARAYLTWSGEAVSSSLDNLDQLVKLPYGCGEQNMISTVPSIYVLDFFKKAGIVEPKVMAKAKKFIDYGYKRQLQYQHRDGSFSAFAGGSGAKGSTWLTAFVVKSFAAARQHVTLSPSYLQVAVNYLMKQQDTRGCFIEHGKVFHSTMKGGVNSSPDKLSLSTYVMGALLESRIDTELGAGVNSSIIDRAVDCIRSGTPAEPTKWKAVSTYAIALRAYVLSVWKGDHPLTRRYAKQLQSRAVNKDGYRYWPMSARSKATMDAYKRPWRPYTAADVETTAYGILASLDDERVSLVSILSPMRWLINERNERGGWYSTQDTVVGLQSLATAAIFVTSGGGATNLNVTIKGVTSNAATPLRDRIRPDDRIVLRKREVRPNATLSITVNGTGCAVLQASLLFNVARVGRNKAPFQLSANATSVRPDCTLSRVRVCARYRGDTAVSNMAIVRAAMASGWAVSSASVRRLARARSPGSLERVEVGADGALLLYYDSIGRRARCVNFLVERRFLVENLKPMLVQVYDYYRPEQAEERPVALYTGHCAATGGRPSPPPTPTPRPGAGTPCPQCGPDANTTEADLVAASCAADESGRLMVGAQRVGPPAQSMWEFVAMMGGNAFGLWRAPMALASDACRCRLPERALLITDDAAWEPDGRAMRLDGAWSVVSADGLDDVTALNVSTKCASALARVLPTRVE